MATTNMRKRIERLEAQHAPNTPQLDAMFWRMVATGGVGERDKKILLDHADALEAGLAHGDPPEDVMARVGIPAKPQTGT